MGVEFEIDVKKLSLNSLILGQVSLALGLPSIGGFLAAKTLLRKSDPKKVLKTVREATAPTHVRYSAVIDDRTTDICKKYDDKVWPIGSPNIKYPPLHWNCRSSLITFRKDQ